MCVGLRQHCCVSGEGKGTGTAGKGGPKGACKGAPKEGAKGKSAKGKSKGKGDSKGDYTPKSLVNILFKQSFDQHFFAPPQSKLLLSLS